MKMSYFVCSDAGAAAQPHGAARLERQADEGGEDTLPGGALLFLSFDRKVTVVSLLLSKFSLSQRSKSINYDIL